MDTAAYARMGEQEEKHWWFAARREIISRLITKCCNLPATPRLLEAGCGTGGNLPFLSSFGTLDAFEFDEASRITARSKSGMDIPYGALPDDAPFADKKYDLIVLLDVLEHIEKDTASLVDLGTRLEGDGRILITVPAMPWLWSKHDVVHHHFRRYTRKTLRLAIENAGLEVAKISYFNFLLFPLAVAKRGFDKMTGSEALDDEIPAAWMNNLFYRIFPHRASCHRPDANAMGVIPFSQLCNLAKRKMIRELGRFGVVGIIATSLHVIVSLLAKEIAGLPEQLANLTGFMIAFWFSFFGHLRYTFSVTGPAQTHFTRFLGMSLVGLILSSSIVYYAAKYTQWPFWLSIGVVGIVVPLFSFFVSKFWTFRGNVTAESDPQTPLVALFLGSQIIAYFYWQSFGDVNHDTAWYLYATPKWLAGAELYTDIIEVNPPWNFYLTIPVVWVSNLTGFTLATSHFAFTGLLTFCSVMWVWKLLRQDADKKEHNATFITQFILVGLLFVTVNQPGQREHMFVLYILPYLVSVYCQLRGAAHTPKQRAALTCFAVLGVMIKPHFALIPVLISITSSIIQFSIRPIFRMENWILLGICLGYLLLSRLVHPQFFEQLLPISLAVYGEFGFNFATVSSRIPIYSIAVLSLCCLVLINTEMRSKASLVIAAAAFASCLIYYLQGTGFSYQSYPFYVFSMCFLVIGLFSGIEQKRQLLFVISLGVFASLSPLAGPYYNKFKTEVLEHTSGLPETSSVLLLSTNVSAGSSIFASQNLRWASRFPAQWFIPGASNKMFKTDCTLHFDDCAKMSEILDLNRELNTQDLLMSSADMIIVDSRKHKSYIKDPDFDYIEFMRADPKFEQDFVQFELAKETQRFTSWRRK